MTQDFPKENKMPQGEDSCSSCNAIKKSLERLRSDIPDLEVIVESFENLFLTIAEVSSKLPEIKLENSEIDPASFSQGLPILRSWKVDIPNDLFLVSAEAMLPAMQKCFPKIEKTLSGVLEHIRNHCKQSYELRPDDKESSSELIGQLVEKLGIDTDLAHFIITQVTKPFAEKISDSLTPLPSGLNWTKGYCPVCGSWPEISFIRGKDGKRSLRCCFCGHEYGFSRLVCPFCENDDQSKMELFYSQDRSFERAEMCGACKKYVVGLDTRTLIYEPAPQVAALGMIYLDILAQEKGFTPGAVCAWNVIGGSGTETSA